MIGQTVERQGWKEGIERDGLKTQVFLKHVLEGTRRENKHPIHTHAEGVEGKRAKQFLRQHPTPFPGKWERDAWKGKSLPQKGGKGAKWRRC